MRLVALAAGHAGEFTWGGTLSIVTLFVVVALPGAVIAALADHRLRWVPLAAGAVVLMVPAVGIAGSDLGATSGLSAIRWAGAGVAGAGVFAAIGLLPVVTLRAIDVVRRTARGTSRTVAQPAA